MRIGHPLTAAATRIRFTRGKKPKFVEATWEDRAWNAAGRLPELHYGTNLRKGIAAKFDYFVARRETPVSEPDRIGTEDDPATGVDKEVLDVFDAEGGADLIRKLVPDFIPHFDYVGKGFLTAFGKPPARTWEVLSTLEIRRATDGKLRRADAAGEVTVESEAVDENNVFVVWRPDPRNRLLSDSPLKASLEVAEQLILLNREMRARSHSRLSAGILFLPDSMDLGADEDVDNPVASFEQELTDRMTRPIQDVGSAGSLVPWGVSADSEDIERIRHLTFERDWDISRDDREELIRRLANGMDLPPEILLGVADLNHWSLWAVQESTITQHVDPTVQDILASLTSGWFIPLLEAAKVPSDGVVLWRDYTPAVTPADNSSQHFQALQAGLIGFAAAAERLGYDVEEAPTTEELEVIGWLRGRGDPSTGVPVDIDNSESGGTPDSAVPGQDEPPEIPEEASSNAHRMQALPETLTPPTSIVLDELAECDAGALDYVLTQAEAALDRVLEKAGARLRSEVQGNPKLQAVARDVPNDELGFLKQFQTAEVVTEADFNPVIARIRQRLARTQTETRTILSRLTESDVPKDPDEDQDLEDGTNSLLAILLAAALAALFTPGGKPDPADVGELRDLRLPASEIRDAISLVGGGTATYSDGGTWELIGNGRRTQQRLTDRGAATLQFRWQYGDPASRVTNFDPHRRLNGVTFESWDDSQLTQGADGAWVSGTHYRPGDHRGCLCRYTREITLRLPLAASG